VVTGKIFRKTIGIFFFFLSLLLIYKVTYIENPVIILIILILGLEIFISGMKIYR